MRCTYHLRLEEQAAYFRRHGLFLSIDALKPEKGNRALYVVRELKFGLVLHKVSLFSTGQLTLERRLLQPVKNLGYRIRGAVSATMRKHWSARSPTSCQGCPIKPANSIVCWMRQLPSWRAAKPSKKP